jgi:hypothetical protein
VKLTEHDKQLIAMLKAERADLLRQARNLRDTDIAEKFGVSRSIVERIPEWRNDPMRPNP